MYFLAVEDFDYFNAFMEDKNRELDAESTDRWWRTKNAPLAEGFSQGVRDLESMSEEEQMRIAIMES